MIFRWEEIGRERRSDPCWKALYGLLDSTSERTDLLEKNNNQ